MSVDQSAYSLDVGSPGSLGLDIGMADPVTDGSHLAADLALRHVKNLPSELVTHTF